MWLISGVRPGRAPSLRICIIHRSGTPASPVPVAGLRPHNGRGALDGQDFGGEAEDLNRAFPVLIPHPPGWVQADGRL